MWVQKWNTVTEILVIGTLGVLFAELSSPETAGSSRNHIG